jgi:ABC-2 type transport system ATP-binding protein
MDSILTTKNLKKYFSGKAALDGIDLDIPLGKIVGLLGPNGSGKTTFIKIAAGILRQSGGVILIDGKVPGVFTKSIVSYLPDRDYLYGWMNIKDTLNFYEDFFKDFDRKKAEDLIQFMNLDMDSKVTSLSKGMMEKLNLSLVIARKAKLYILDEPLSGVDPTAREKIIDTIVANFRTDSTMIISTHQVNTMEKLFDRVLFLSDGKIVLDGDAEELRNEKNMSIDELFREVFR